MAIALPAPANPWTPGGPPGRARAFKRWRDGQDEAQRQQWRRAAQAFDDAASLIADKAYLLAAAHAMIKARRPEEALSRTRRVRERFQSEALAYTLEAHALIALDRAEDAVTCLLSLPADVPRDHDHRSSLAIALQASQRHGEAIPAFFDALALKLDDAVTHYRLSTSLQALGMKAEAAECLRTALILGLGDDDLVACGQLAFHEREACRWAMADEALQSLSHRLHRLPDEQPIQASSFAHAVLVDDPMAQLKAARHQALHLASSIRPLPAAVARPRVAARQTHRLRVAYLSSDFHHHATSQLMVQMLESHDRSTFDITLLSTGKDDASPLRQRMQAASEHFEELRGQPFDQVARRVRELGIDILVDLKGGTADTPFPVMAYRAAPLQVSWLGFPGTSGAPFIDYLIGDPVVTPLDHAAHFSEKIAQLPGCYQPNDSHRPLPRASTRAEWGVADDQLLLCAFHQSYKISAELFGVWCDLLHALPDAVLWLLQWNTNVQATLEVAARERGIAPGRIVFAPLLPLADHLSRLACADVYLDAWPCNAHTTASEALWVGLPVVTLLGDTFAQRVAGSLLHAVGLDELVCDDVASYCATVSSLATDPARRTRLREHLLAQRGTNALFDGAAHAREIEALYERMWQRHTNGWPADHLAALPASRAQPTASNTDHLTEAIA